MNCELMLTYDTPALQQTGIRNLTGPKTLLTIWHTYMKLVTKYQIPVINSCLEKCDEKWAYMFNVYKNQQSRQTGSRNLMGPKALPTIWGHRHLFLVTFLSPRHHTHHKARNRSSVKNPGHRDPRAPPTRRSPAWRNGPHHPKPRQFIYKWCTKHLPLLNLNNATDPLPRVSHQPPSSSWSPGKPHPAVNEKFKVELR